MSLLPQHSSIQSKRNSFPQELAGLLPSQGLLQPALFT